jgi:tetratricopeptide (TPR) repeat protein
MTSDSEKICEDTFQKFRRDFFKALEHRRLDECQQLLQKWLSWLDNLQTPELPRLQWEYTYHTVILLYECSEFAQAETLLRNLLATDPTPWQRARAQLELGLIYLDQGLYEDAANSFLAAQSAYGNLNEAQLAISIMGQARVYNNLGITHTEATKQGVTLSAKFSDAVTYHQIALTLLQTLLPSAADDAKWEVARNEHGLGMAHGLAKRYDEAQTALPRYIDQCQQLHDFADRARGLTDLAALVYLPRQQFALARQTLNKAIPILRQHRDDLSLAEALMRRGQVWSALGHPARALRNYKAAIATVESIHAQLTVPIVRAGYRSTVGAIYAAPLFLHLQNGNVRDAFTAAERMRSRVLGDLLSGQKAQSVPASATLLEKRQALQKTLETLYTQQMHELEMAAPDQPLTIKQLESMVETIDRQIELVDPKYATLQSSEALTAEQICERLPVDAAILTFVTDENDHYWALFATHKGGVQGKLVAGYGVKWLQSFLLNYLEKQDRLLDAKPPRLQAPRLYPTFFKSLIDPLLPWLESTKTLYIIPTGPLHYIPLGALTADPLSTPLLLEKGLRVVYIPSATVLLNYCHKRPASPNQGILALAPQDTQLSCTYGAARKISALVGARPKIGKRANQHTLLTQAEHYQILCFFGHASFNADRPMLCQRNLSPVALERRSSCISGV